MSIFKTKIPKKVLSNPPKHIAMICDGNGRWAKKRGLPRTVGHEIGSKVVKDISQACAEAGVKYVTLYAFSTENWTRPKEEVEFLMKLFTRFFREWRKEAIDKGIHVKHIGLLEALPLELRKEIELTQLATDKNKKMTVNIALNYGGRQEITQAVKRILHKRDVEQISAESIDARMIDSNLFTSNQPDVDLLIRPGTENRLSNFLLWQASNAVIVTLPLFWPDFRRKYLWRAIANHYKNGK